MLKQAYRVFSSNLCEQKSAMHIHVISLGLTKSTVEVVNGMLGRDFTADEVEFFCAYTAHLNVRSPPNSDFT